MEEKKLFLLDAFALIYRSYYAFIKNPRINSKGLNTSAVFGFTNTMLDVIKNQKPTHLAVVFDPSGPTVRHDEFPAYKAQRDETPEDIKKSVPIIKELLKAFNIPALEAKGYEADDVIGTLAKKAEKEGFVTYMMTPDKDFGQLVSEKIFMFKPPRMGNGAEVWGIPEVCARFEVEHPLQVIDILGLWGDAVDNIPGVPGVGEKTAKKLVAQYGSIEGLYEHTDELKGKLKEKVEANHEQALLSKKLATIILDAPVDLIAEDLLICEPNKDDIQTIFEDLEFQQLGRKVLGMDIKVNYSATPKAAPAAKKEGPVQGDLFGAVDEVAEESATLKTLETVKHDYKLVNTEEEIDQMLAILKAADAFCYDTETTGLNTLSDELVGVSFSHKAHTAYYVPLSADKGEATKTLEKLQPLFSGSQTKIAHNSKFDNAMLAQYGIDVAGPYFDTLLAHFVIHPDMNRRSMDVLSETYLNYSPISITTLLGKKGADQKTMRDVPSEEVLKYAGEDADVTFQLHEIFKKELKENNSLELYEQIETPLIPVLMHMEREGVKLDAESLHNLSKELATDIDKIETGIYADAGKTFNIASPKQVGVVLFEDLKVVDKPKKTKTGQYATNEEVLTKLVGTHDIVEKILTFRELQKLKNTYVDPLPELINSETKRIHTTYNQFVAATGRLSSDHPNLQNIPIRSERGREIRKAFIPRDENHILMAADYSQVELRIIAALSGDESMLEAFKNGQDIHAATAAKVFGVPLEEVTSDMRRKAKMVNFGIIYGISAFGLSQRLNIPRKEAKEIIDNYFANYPKIKSYMDESIEKAKTQGYVETIMGRRRYLRDINSSNAVVRGFAERNAINAPIQGSAADIIKKAMLNIHAEMQEKAYKSRMILQVHDELVFDVEKSELETMRTMVADKMTNAVQMEVSFDVEIGTGTNWLEAH